MYFDDFFLNFNLTVNSFKILFLFSTSLVFIGFLGFVFCKKTILHLMLCVELIFIGNFMTLVFSSLSLSDFKESVLSYIYGLFILTIAASESAISLSIIIVNYRLHGSVFISKIRNLTG
jgi:NADH-quinone oxidoreductase subunit K